MKWVHVIAVATMVAMMCPPVFGRGLSVATASDGPTAGALDPANTGSSIIETPPTVPLVEREPDPLPDGGNESDGDDDSPDGDLPSLASPDPDLVNPMGRRPNPRPPDGPPDSGPFRPPRG